MSVTTNEKVNLLGDLGIGKVPYSASSPTIAQTLGLEMSVGVLAGTSGKVMFSAIYLPIASTITYINYVSGSTAEGTGAHLWYALYDDGRGSSTAGQLALLGQTTDQTGASVFGANSVLTLALQNPFTTTYSGLYFVGIMCAASTMPTLVYATTTSLISITSSGVGAAPNAGSSLTNLAPNPSGAITNGTSLFYAYIS